MFIFVSFVLRTLQIKLALSCEFDACIRLSLHTSQMAHHVGAYPGFCSMKQLEVFLLPPGWDASPSQGYPKLQVCRYLFIQLSEERHCESSVLPENTTQCPRPGLEPRVH